MAAKKSTPEGVPRWLIKSFAIKSSDLGTNKNKGLCFLIYPKHPKTTFFGVFVIRLSTPEGVPLSHQVMQLLGIRYPIAAV
jgi:hypothetical protein